MDYDERVRLLNKDVSHYFVIRYLDLETRNKMRDVILRLISRHELCNFFIEEKQAYHQNKVLYNFHILFLESQMSNFKEVDKRFLKYLC